jgi:hypothetical protein
MEAPDMATQPNPCFPLLESDKAEVIRIYLELVQGKELIPGLPSVPTFAKTLRRRDDAGRGSSRDLNGREFPSELLDSE